MYIKKSYGPELDIAYYRHELIVGEVEDYLDLINWAFRVHGSHAYEAWFDIKPIYDGETPETIVGSAEDYRAVMFMYMGGGEL